MLGNGTLVTHQTPSLTEDKFSYVEVTEVDFCILVVTRADVGIGILVLGSVTVIVIVDPAWVGGIVALNKEVELLVTAELDKL